MSMTMFDRAKASASLAARLATDRAFQRNLKFRLRILSLVPPLVGFAAMALLASIPQMREVYLGIIVDRDIVGGTLGFLLLVLLCAFLYTWHFWLGTGAVNSVYPEHADLQFDLALMSWRDNKALICAALPLAGLVLGLIALTGEATNVGGRFGEILQYFDAVAGTRLRTEYRQTGSILAWMPVYVSVAVVMIFAALAAIHVGLRRAWLGPRLRTYVTWSAAVLAGLATVLPLLMPDLTVSATRFIGPLAATALVLIWIATVVAGISYVVKWADAAVMKGLAAAAVVLIGLAILVSNLGASRSARTAEIRRLAQPPEGLDKLKGEFKTWLARRGDRAKYAGAKYPVLVFAAQGGGIYAASAAALFLSSMQDECANFAQHVFAISGVSGGAVGTAVFTGLIDGVAPSPNLCTGLVRTGAQPAAEPITDLAEQIVLADHLSPVVGLIAPDILRKLPVWPFPMRVGFDRSNALERSFACAFDEAIASGVGGKPSSRRWCTGTGSGTGLRVPYTGVWAIDKAVPAPILNTTWAETGFRVAFAPFPLRAVGDGTLFNFTELPLKKDQVPKSLIEAAFVSARFPGIVPARRIEPDLPGLDLKWNFVDGGYVDNSGSATALELYKTLSRFVEDDKLEVDLRLVLLTAAETELDYGHIRGSLLYDSVAPVQALLNVRSQLSQRAVTEAIETVDAEHRRVRPDRRAPEAKDHRVYVVDVEQQTFRLPLGWKISPVTNDIVRLMMGRPDLCPQGERKPADDSIKSIVHTVEQNSCVKRNIVRLLKKER